MRYLHQIRSMYSVVIKVFNHIVNKGMGHN